MQRLDKTLLLRGLVTSRAHAQRLITAGCVRVNGQLQRKASAIVAEDSLLEVIATTEDRFVSRGGLKLAAALERCDIPVAGVTALDVGQSTGGFTDCLLQAGASQVVGVDVGHGQLAVQLKNDPRVVCYEGVNARELPASLCSEHAPAGFALAVMDVSFISQTLILPALAPLIAPGGQLVSLVKPQFEVGRSNIGKGGIVRNAELFDQVEQQLKTVCQQQGLDVQEHFESPITGGDGNREFLLVATRQ
ncbi:MAG TPA: TlyA family RNA methyltransferase [Cellvibrionaceae bacterium]